MSEEMDESKNVSVSVPIGALGAVLMLGLVGAVYAYLQQGDEDGGVQSTVQGAVQSAMQKAKPKKSTRRKLGLMALIAAIENDASRKVLITFLRALSKRS